MLRAARVELAEVPSESMGRKVKVVYVVPDREEDGVRCPVVYLLHGHGGYEMEWLRFRPDLPRLADELGFIFACVDGENSWYWDSPLHPEYRYETFMAVDLVKYTDGRYATVARKEGRAIAGLSMGGFHSLHISCYYPDAFDYVGLFSAAIRHREGLDSPVYRDVEAQIARQFSKAPGLYYIAIGDEDFLYKDNCGFREFLDSKGYPYEYHESGEGHIWKNWRIYLSDFVTKLFK